MNVFDSITSIVLALLLFIALAILIVAVWAIKVSQLPPGNPLKALLGAVCRRLGFTVGVGLAALPVQVIPGFDAAVDIVAFLGLAIFWATLIHEIKVAFADAPGASVAKPDVKHEAPHAIAAPPTFTVRSLSERRDKAAPRLRW
jgi:hypothetical protein